jgi:uncharacterized protein YdeI (YjbR/CyaY-like superfamily)
MASSESRIDTYIERAAPFAQPVLQALRKALHEACPHVEETMKWSMPFFTVDGRILAHMAAFKQHCAFGFWRGRQVANQGKEDEAMGQFGRIATIADLPPRRELVRLIKQAAATPAPVAAQKTPPTPPRREAKPSLPVPEPLSEALRRNAGARANFEKFSNSQRREYIEWIAEAKRDETRARRVAQAIEWLAEGKTRNWKYEAG